MAVHPSDPVPLLAASRPGAWLGGSDMAGHIRAFPWEHTSLGPLAGWPASLTSALGICLHSRFQMAVYWGPELLCLYNDAERDILGELHPGALGRPARDLLADSWAVVGPPLRAVMERAEASWAEDEELRFNRDGTLTVGYFTYSYSPILEPDGAVGGVLLVTEETTTRVLAERRTELLRRLTAETAGASSERTAAARAASALSGSADFPEARVLLGEPAARALATSDEATRVLPVRRAAGQAGALAVVVNPELPLDDAYRRFLAAAAAAVERALGAARAREAERRDGRRAERARTEHELRAAHRRAVTAADAERRRIERDLHDGAQQRLVAIQLELGLLAERLDEPARRSEVERLQTRLADALEEIRVLAHGLFPPLLASDGLGAALTAAARHAALPTTVRVSAVPRAADEVESAVYFCCLEALQNAAKHAGSDARATIEVGIEADELCFRVRDDGGGFDPERRPGAGFVTLRDRLAALGGALEIASAPGAGTTVTGRVPLT